MRHKNGLFQTLISRIHSSDSSNVLYLRRPTVIKTAKTNDYTNRPFWYFRRFSPLVWLGVRVNVSENARHPHTKTVMLAQWSTRVLYQNQGAPYSRPHGRRKQRATITDHRKLNNQWWPGVGWVCWCWGPARLRPLACGVLILWSHCVKDPSWGWVILYMITKLSCSYLARPQYHL